MTGNSSIEGRLSCVLQFSCFNDSFNREVENRKIMCMTCRGIVGKLLLTKLLTEIKFGISCAHTG